MCGSRTLDRETIQFKCEFAHTLEGEYCGDSGEVELDGLLLCRRHADWLRLEEQVACWEAMVLHADLWIRDARNRGGEDVIGLLEIERSRAAEELGRVREELSRIEGAEDLGRRRRSFYGTSSLSSPL